MVMWFMHIHQLDTLYQSKGSKIHLGSSGVTGVKNVNFYSLNDWIRRLTDLILSFFFFFLTICFFFHMLERISTKLGQNDQWVSGYKSYALFDLKGHVRVTGVKKVIFTENASPPTCFIGFWRNLVRSISGLVATKVMLCLTSKVM